ncbi:hypothetical protein B0H14DRAFT_2651338 [Mycena olivaceomarginata]|nr:hypothetical protein B0H14DRAFT_2651338 [Mycena olivaceomarginata]
MSAPVRKPIPREVADQKILNEMDDDAHKYRGPNTVKWNLALAGVHISRRIIRDTMHLNDPDGVDARYPGWKKIKRAQLKAHDDRHSDVIGHVFLDFVELYGAIPQQATVDKGSETGHITAYAPDIDLTRYPALVAVKSTNNTPIEGLWHWFQDQCGKNLYIQITKGLR